MVSLPAAFLDRPIAHRALHGAGRPENSPAAIRAAASAGYGIEIDLQLSADGQAMVFHDDTLNRLTEASGPVRARTAQDLSQITLLGGTEGVPTLKDVLQVVDGAVPLLIEIKDQDGRMGQGIGALEQAAAKAVQGYDGPVAFMSFNPHAAAEMARLCPDRPRGLTTCAYDAEAFPDLTEPERAHLRAMPGLAQMKASFISHHHSDLDSPYVAAQRSRGLDVLCWTIRSPTQEAQARQIAQNVTFEGYSA